MNIYHNLDEVPFDSNTVITIGTFDGVHLGHRFLIDRLKKCALERNSRHLLITFEPHPQIVIKKEGRPEISLLTTICERLELFRNYGIENVLIIEFTHDFSKLESYEFIQLLVDNIGLKKLLVGYDHSFGRNRSGNFETLVELSKEKGFELERVEPYQVNGQVISSSRIRKALRESQLEDAHQLLGYNYFIEGVVQFGRGVGVQIGFPTANIRPDNIHKLLPKIGVYLVSSIIGENEYFGLANIGVRPTLTNDTKPQLEVHFLDFEGDLYDERLHITFHQYLRNEIKFADSDHLVQQIKCDVKQAQAIIKTWKKSN